jgi:hypothetical protein
VDQYAGQDSDFLRLQVWLRRQALMLAKGKLPEKRQAMLRKLGVRLKVDLALVKKYAQLQVGCKGGCGVGERCGQLLQGLVVVPQLCIHLGAPIPAAAEIGLLISCSSSSAARRSLSVSLAGAGAHCGHGSPQSRCCATCAAGSECL